MVATSPGDAPGVMIESQMASSSVGLGGVPDIATYRCASRVVLVCCERTRHGV